MFLKRQNNPKYEYIALVAIILCGDHTANRSQVNTLIFGLGHHTIIESAKCSVSFMGFKMRSNTMRYIFSY